MGKRKHTQNPSQSKKRKIHPENDSSSEEENITKVREPKEKEYTSWMKSDILELLSNIEKSIPENDSLSYNSRLAKINWYHIVFKQYSVKQCKQMWLDLLKKVRKFRLLEEIVTDIKSLVESPESTISRHSEKPKQPLNSYMLFVEENRCDVMKKYPGLNSRDVFRKLGELFKTLPMKEKKKYNKLAEAGRLEYEEKLKVFYAEHPELIPQKGKRSKKLELLDGTGPPEKPKTPFQLFVQVESENTHTEEALYCLRQKCEERWSEMTDNDKLFWIRWAEEQYNKYLEDLKEFLKKHPDYEPKTISVLSRKEKKIRDRLSGRPEKPPRSAYHLFLKMMMENEEVQKIKFPEAITYISGKWNALPEDEKDEYRTRIEQMWEEYETKLEEYMMTLPPEKRDDVKFVRRKKKRQSKPKSTPESKEKKNKPTGQNKQLPKLPPSTEYKLFLRTYKGKKDPLVVWDSMSEDEKQVFAEKLTKMKQEYIARYEDHLKSLTKEELKEFAESQKYLFDTSSDSESSEQESDDVD